ncbi:MAG: pilin [Christensenellaceae bacterium]|jgi:type IV secretory pathway VirB2 component (pilin)|nr:pilin [Christensenellaceae bacterium]
MRILGFFLSAVDTTIKDGNVNALDNLQRSLEELISKIYPYLIGGVAAVVALWAAFLGVKWWAAGDQDKRREAKEYIKNFIIGTVLIFVLATGITSLIGFLGGFFSNR